MIARANTLPAANFWQSPSGWVMIVGHELVRRAAPVETEGRNMKLQIALVPILALSAISGALAQSQDEQQACTNDAFQFCQNFIPDRNRVFTCLVDNRRVISPACRQVIAAYAPPDPPPPPVAKNPVKRPKTTKSAKTGPLDLSPH